MNDRIRLAEAMGWVEWHGIGDYPRTWRLYGPGGLSWTERKLHELPDPETDANDDYAVLEWARKEWNGKGQWANFVYALGQGNINRSTKHHYQRGDYARAALKVIDG